VKNHRTSIIDSLRAALVILAMAGLTACASAPPEITYYLLRPPVEEGSGAIDAPIRAGLGRVIVAPYLERTNGIQIEMRDGEIRPATQYQWAEALAAGVRWYLRAQVGERLGHQIGGGLTDRRDWDYTVDVFVERLHGTMTGEAVLVASFIVRGGTTATGVSELYEYRFSESTPLSAEGYTGVVEAEKALLAEFAGRIADALRERIAARERAAES
jgi:uncharacterized lipoprotein YmbA